MSVQFKTVGFINFNKDYNKVLKSGAITVSFTSSSKNKDGEYEKKYYSAIIPAKYVEEIKPLLNKELCDIEGIITPAVKGYFNFTILKASKHQQKTTKQEQEIETGLPF